MGVTNLFEGGAIEFFCIVPRVKHSLIGYERCDCREEISNRIEEFNFIACFSLLWNKQVGILWSGITLSVVEQMTCGKRQFKENLIAQGSVSGIFDKPISSEVINRYARQGVRKSAENV